MKLNTLASSKLALALSSLLWSTTAHSETAGNQKPNLLLIHAQAIATDIAVIEQNSDYHIDAANIDHFIQTKLSLSLNQHPHHGDQAIFYIEETDLDVNCHIVVDFVPIPRSDTMHKTISALTDECQL